MEILFYSCCAFWLIFKKYSRKVTSKVTSWKRRASYLFALYLLLNLPVFPNAGSTGYLSIFSFVFLGGIWVALFDLKKVSSFEAIFVVTSSFIAHNYAIGTIRPGLYSLGAFSLYGYFAFIVLFALRGKLRTRKIVVQLSSLTYLIYLFHNWLLDMFFVWFQLQPYNSDGRIPLLSRSVSLVLFLIEMWLIHNFYEKPILKFGKKLTSRNYPEV